VSVASPFAGTGIRKPTLGGGELLVGTLLFGHAPHAEARLAARRTVTATGFAFEIVTTL